MSNDDKLKIEEFITEESFKTHESIIEEDSELYAQYIAEGLIFSLKKSEPQFRKDKIIVLLNSLIYKFNCSLCPTRKDVRFESHFDLTISFIADFKNILKEIEAILSSNSTNSELVADIYLYYLALANIYSSFFSRFTDSLKQEELEARKISSLPRSDKSLENNIEDFEIIQKLIRELK